MSDPNRKLLRKTIFEVIENQMRDGTPPETKRTYDRLIAAGHTHIETMELIGCVVTTEIFEVTKHKQPFNESRYVAALQTLPELPWDEGDDE